MATSGSGSKTCCFALFTGWECLERLTFRSATPYLHLHSSASPSRAQNSNEALLTELLAVPLQACAGLPPGYQAKGKWYCKECAVLKQAGKIS